MEFAKSGGIHAKKLSCFSRSEGPKLLSSIGHEARAHMVLKRHSQTVCVLLNDLINPASASHTAPLVLASQNHCSAAVRGCSFGTLYSLKNCRMRSIR
jgi:hypothetical protein